MSSGAEGPGHFQLRVAFTLSLQLFVTRLAGCDRISSSLLPQGSHQGFLQTHRLDAWAAPLRGGTFWPGRPEPVGLLTYRARTRRWTRFTLSEGRAGYRTDGKPSHVLGVPRTHPATIGYMTGAGVAAYRFVGSLPNPAWILPAASPWAPPAWRGGASHALLKDPEAARLAGARTVMESLAASLPPEVQYRLGCPLYEWLRPEGPPE
jgi:hypothetical protein